MARMSPEEENEVLSEQEAEEEVEASNDEAEDQNESEEISGWADSMLKILKSTKPKSKKNLLLSRARKDYEVSKNPKPDKKRGGGGGDIEIEPDDKKILDAEDGNDEETKKKSKKKEDDNILSLKQQRKLELRQRKLEHAWENLNRLTAEVPDRQMETDLMKIATKGVVQLFNAVSQQQKTMKTKLRASGKSEFKKEKVLSQSKDVFDKAMKKNKIVGVKDESSDNDSDYGVKVENDSSSEEDDVEDSRRKRVQIKRKQSNVLNGESSSSKKPMWQALQDNFMLGANLKDWDKESNSD